MHGHARDASFLRLAAEELPDAVCLHAGMAARYARLSMSISQQHFYRQYAANTASSNMMPVSPFYGKTRRIAAIIRVRRRGAPGRLTATPVRLDGQFAVPNTPDGFIMRAAARMP